MSIIVYDLEWNMGVGSPHEPVLQEIVQIGAVKLESWTGGIVSEFKAFVRPSAHRKLHHRVKKMLPFGLDALKAGKGFLDTLGDFRAWCGESPSFYSWGNCDIGVLRENLRFYKVSDDWLTSLYDLQATYGVATQNLTHAVSLHDAVEAMNIEEDDVFHDAFCDARYTARVGMALLGPGGRDAVVLRESGCAQQLLGLTEDDAVKLVADALEQSVPYYTHDCTAAPDLKALLSGRSARLFRCPNCNNAVLTSVWYQLGAVCMSRTSCPKDGRIYTVLRVAQDDEGRWGAAMSAYPRSELLQTAFLACKGFGTKPALNPLPGKKRKRRRRRWYGKPKSA